MNGNFKISFKIIFITSKNNFKQYERFLNSFNSQPDFCMQRWNFLIVFYPLPWYARIIKITATGCISDDDTTFYNFLNFINE